MSVAQMAHALMAECSAHRCRDRQPENTPPEYFPPHAGLSSGRTGRRARGSPKSTCVTALSTIRPVHAEKRRRRNAARSPTRISASSSTNGLRGRGDCGVQSNCVAIEPVLKTGEFGRKRAIDQDACNKDFSCLKGFCPLRHRAWGSGASPSGRPDIAAFAAPPDRRFPARAALFEW